MSPAVLRAGKHWIAFCVCFLMANLCELPAMAAGDRNRDETYRKLKVLYYPKFGEDIGQWYPAFREFIEAGLLREGPKDIETMSGYLSGHLPASRVSWQRRREVTLLSEIFLKWAHQMLKIDLNDKKSSTGRKILELYHIARKTFLINSHMDQLMCARSDPSAWSQILKNNPLLSFVPADLKPQPSELIYLPGKDKGYCLYQDLSDFHDEVIINQLQMNSRLTTDERQNLQKLYISTAVEVISDDQITWDYAYEVYNAFNPSYKFLYSGLLRMNIEEGLLLTPEQLGVLAEAMMNKDYLLFRLEDISGMKMSYVRRESIVDMEEIGDRKDAMEPLLKVLEWLRLYKMEELRGRFLDRFFVSDLGVEALTSIEETALADEVAKRLEEKKAREQEQREKQRQEKQGKEKQRKEMQPDQKQLEKLPPEKQ